MKLSLSIFNFKQFKSISKIGMKYFLRAMVFVIYLEIVLRVGGFMYGKYYEWDAKLQMDKNQDYTILCLGDSITKFSYPATLQRALNETFFPKKILVVNGGHGGFSSYEVYEQLNDNLIKYKPDIVIVMIGFADASFTQLIPDNDFAKIRFLIVNRSFSFRVLWRLAKKIKVAVNQISVSDIQNASKKKHAGSDSTLKNRNVDKIDEFEFQFVFDKKLDYPKALRDIHTFSIRNFNGIVQKAQAFNVPLILMQYPMTDIAPLKNIIRNPEGIVFVENKDNFETVLKNKSYSELFNDRIGDLKFGHLSSTGSQLIVDELEEAIGQLLLIDRSSEH